MDRLTRRLRPVAVALLALTAPLAGQDRSALVERCAASGAGAIACRDAAFGVEAVIGGVGSTLTGGNEFPGSASTLGFRFGTTPRVATSLRVGLADVSVPAIDGTGAESGETSSWIPSIQGAIAVGVFDGFRPRPTVGGVLAVDVLATAGVAFLPSGGGYDGSVPAFGYGLRLGLVRESFSLPGVTASLVRRHGGSLRWEGVDGLAQEAVELDGVATTSLRATVGRELMALGIQAGLGWDRATADGSARPTGGAGEVAFDGFSADRVLFFGGVTATWLITQFHGELAYLSGYEAREGGAAGGVYDPTAGSLLATLTFRLLL